MRLQRLGHVLALLAILAQASAVHLALFATLAQAGTPLAMDHSAFCGTMPEPEAGTWAIDDRPATQHDSTVPGQPTCPLCVALHLLGGTTPPQATIVPMPNAWGQPRHTHEQPLLLCGAAALRPQARAPPSRA